jgi:uncharacterized protein Smg (DUF494 family)
MDDRMAHLISRLRKRFSAHSDVAEVEAWLSSEGFDRGQIGEIVSAFQSEVGVTVSGTTGAQGPSLPFRVLGPHERGRFSTEAWGHLLSLAGSGLLSASDFESVIERAMSQIEGRITLEDLKTLVESGGLDDFGISPDRMTIH